MPDYMVTPDGTPTDEEVASWNERAEADENQTFILIVESEDFQMPRIIKAKSLYEVLGVMRQHPGHYINDEEDVMLDIPLPKSRIIIIKLGEIAFDASREKTNRCLGNYVRILEPKETLRVSHYE